MYVFCNLFCFPQDVNTAFSVSCYLVRNCWYLPGLWQWCRWMWNLLLLFCSAWLLACFSLLQLWSTIQPMCVIYGRDQACMSSWGNISWLWMATGVFWIFCLPLMESGLCSWLETWQSKLGFKKGTVWFPRASQGLALLSSFADSGWVCSWDRGTGVYLRGGDEHASAHPSCTVMFPAPDLWEVFCAQSVHRHRSVVLS